MSVLSDKLRAARCPKAAGVVVAAGSGTRFGGDKLRSELCGMPVLIHSLMAFQKAERISEIVLVTRPDAVEETAAICRGYGIEKLTVAVPGGKTRAESSFAGVMAVSDGAGVIAIHDGARPLVTPTLIDAVVWDAYRHGAAAPAIPVRDTVKLASNHIVLSTPDRSSLFAMQTPQCFQRDVIRGAFQEAVRLGRELTDDCMAVECIGGQVWLTDGCEENIKITTPLDLALAELILQRRQSE